MFSFATRASSTTAAAAPSSLSPTSNNVKKNGGGGGGGGGPHETFIHNTMLPLTIQLQKEVRGRRFREIQKTLQEAVTALVAFQSETWPPPPAATAPAAAAATAAASQRKSPEMSPNVQQQQRHTADDDDNDDDDGEEETVEFEDATTSTTKSNNISRNPQTTDSATASATTTTPLLFCDNDPQTCEPVHDAVVACLEAYIAVLGHPAKTPKACELALQGISKLVQQRYFSGRAGGWNDMSGSGSGSGSSLSSLSLQQQQQQQQQQMAAAGEVLENSASTTTTATAASSTTTETQQQQQQQPRVAASLLHRVLESVAKCGTSSEIINNTSSTIIGDSVQAAMVNTLRMIMTSPKCGVHENSMLLALRTTFHVYLVTKTATCKDNAKAALLDMLRSVLTRMEAHHAVNKARKKQQQQQHHHHHHDVAMEGVASSSVVSSSSGGGGGESSSTGSTGGSVVLVENPTPKKQQHQQQDTDKDNSSSITDNAKDNVSTTTTTTISHSTTTSFPSQYHADSYALLRSLCKLSSKELPADTVAEPDRATARLMFNTQIPMTDPLALNSKILSLELILAALDYCGEAWSQGDPRFVHLIQHYLCVSLLKNCVSHHTQVAFLSQKIFLVLTFKFKGHLKQEIEVFLSNVFLRVLDSQNSSFKQKALVLESLRTLCRDPVLLTQIFLNYDCDFDAMNLYKDIVHMLTKLGGKATAGSAASSGVSKRDAEQDFELSLAGIEVLVTILKAFLRALGLPGGEEGSDDSAGARIRGILQLDVGLAAMAEDPRDGAASMAASTDVSVASSDNMSASDIIAARIEQNGGEPSSETADGASSSAAGKIVDAFQMKRNAEQNFEIGAVKFTLSLKSGLNFFIDNGFVECDAKKVAIFFLNNKDKLDKTQMGEALGREPGAAFVKGDGIDAEKGGPGFWVRLLHHYVAAMDFTDLMFDEAIRQFLSGFRLPGEAQKIDRIMEKFAERFTSQNPTIFPSADTAFILAFSVIMLNTDLHNPSIKPERRMTQDSFLKNNRGIGENGGDLPEEFLIGIFNRIKERPFSLKEDDAAREKASAQKQIFDSSVFFEGSALFGTSAEERKRENFKKERDEMMAMTEQLIRRRPGKNEKSSAETTRFMENIAPADVVKPMFDVTWGPMIGILSQVLECSDDERSVAVCLNGFVYAVRVAANSHMSLARDTFVSSLAKFTFLGSIKEMKRKNVECIRTLLSIAVIDGEHLEESWAPVLQCISQLARLRLKGSGLDSDESFLVEKDKSKGNVLSNRPMDNLFWQQNKIDLAKMAEESNGRAVLEAIQEVLIDKVFSSTVSLSAKSLAHFVEQLITVSSSEIEGHSKRGITGVESSGNISEHSNSGKDGPSIFSLQKLVEVADFNMGVRPRLVWAQVWELMADFFAKNACHENPMVSVFAIDSLKQLSFKFLEKTELAEFNFQRLFLKPFLDVMEDKNSREDVRELVLRCVDNIIRTKSHNLRSGWKIVFSILTFSASDPSQKVEYLGLAILQRLLDEHLDEVCTISEKQHLEGGDASDSMSIERKNRNASADDFVNLCKASLAFVQREESDSESPRPVGLSMRALCHTAIYADIVAEKRVLPPDSGAQTTDPTHQGYTYAGLSNQESLEMVLWRPLFEGVADGIKSPARSIVGGVGCIVPRASVLALRAILLRHGSLFSAAQLSAILRQTILPAIQHCAEYDKSPVARITSESPAVSSVDFLVDSLPLPPPPDDQSLQLLEAMTSTPNRSMGPAELMLEASFTDLRHGGDGDLRRAYILAKKSEVADAEAHEQPFPDSWIATTAPVALGLLTDIVTEIMPSFMEKERDAIWTAIAKQYEIWFLGLKAAFENELSNDWRPCEALVRISCHELGRLAERILDAEHREVLKDGSSWTMLLFEFFSHLLSESTETQIETREALIESKEQAALEGLGSENADDVTTNDRMQTAFGSGILTKEMNNVYEDPTSGNQITMTVHVIALDFGGTLYQPVALEDEEIEAPEINVPDEVNVPAAYWQESVQILKVRCVAARCLSQSLVSGLKTLIPAADEIAVSKMLDSLNRSRSFAANAAKDEVISTAFQQALLSDWNDIMPDESGEVAARMSLQHGSGVFFLAQEAGNARTMVQLLALLYSSNTDDWDRVAFAEPHLLEIFQNSLSKFLQSEAKDGHLVDPNTWRNASERGGKLALYCTFFVPVIVEMLKIIRSLTTKQFEKHKQEFFSAACQLIRVQSDEIRSLVQDILAIHVAPRIRVTVDLTGCS